MNASGNVAGRLGEVVDSLSALDRAERIEALIDLAASFVEVPEGIAQRPFPPERRVPACESQAFVFAEPLADGSLKFHFAVENPQGLSARAFAVVLDRVFSGAAPQEILDAGAPEEVVEAVFGRELSLGKQLGLAGMLQMLQREARERLDLSRAQRMDENTLSS